MTDLDRAKTSFFEALDHLDSGNLEAAEASFRATLAIVPQHGPSLNNIAVIFLKQGRIEELMHAAEAALAADPDQIDAHQFLASCYKELKRWKEALPHLRRIVALEPNNAEALANESFIFNQLRQFEDAIASADRALGLDPHIAAAHLNRGNALRQLKRYDDALAVYDAMLATDGELAKERSWLGRAEIVADMERYEEAIADCGRVLQLNPASTGAMLVLGRALTQLSRYEEAFAVYDEAAKIAPDDTDFQVARAEVFIRLQRYEDALRVCDETLAIDPETPEALLVRGNALMELNRNQEALESYRRAVSLMPAFAEAWLGIGVVYFNSQRHSDAIAAFEKAISYKPNLDFVYGPYLTARQSVCDWHDYGERIERISAAVARGDKIGNPFSLLSTIDNPELHKAASASWIATKFSAKNPLPKIGRYAAHNKIRVGYFSADLQEHPVGKLMASLIEQHDKSRFEVVAFSFGVESDDEIRRRIQDAVDQFIDVRLLPDRDVAAKARELELDIAVDLAGFTKDSRTGIFSARAAPVQVNYLGYPGTVVADYMDYMIADRTVIPDSYRKFYGEKIARVPNTFFPNDAKRIVSDRQFSRAELGLPAEGFVFCSFNNSYKITPDVFADWMSILKQVDGSVLWLLEDNQGVPPNLRREAEARGIDPDRLVFARRVPLLADHLARYRTADLFLDTLPYNAHMTASDALWAGVPVLTRRGESFASRVASSLLQAVGMPELIVTTREDYVDLGVTLARDPARLKGLREKLAANRLTTPLFDITAFTADLEQLYAKMYERHGRGLPPEHMDVT